MAEPRITIIGLGLIGGSIGLGLAAGAKSVQIVGHDIDQRRNKLAQKKGAVHKSTFNLIDACENADLVIIATPITEIRETLELIGPHLKQGCVVTDTATLKGPVLAWAAETLPAGVSFVGGDPLLNPNAQSDPMTVLEGLESAHADLFQDAVYAICPPPEASPTAVKRVTDMISLIKARPFYVDPVEHDGMRAAVAGLPVLTSLALMQEVVGSAGWKEGRKMADHVFGTATAVLGDNPEAQRAQVLLNAEYVLPRLDSLIRHLAQLRGWIAADDAASLDDAFEQAASARLQWLAERATSKWDEELGELGITGTMGALGSMVGLGSSRGKPKDA